MIEVASVGQDGCLWQYFMTHPLARCPVIVQRKVKDWPAEMQPAEEVVPQHSQDGGELPDWPVDPAIGSPDFWGHVRLPLTRGIRCLILC